MKARVYAPVWALLIVAELSIIGCGEGSTTSPEATDAELRLPETIETVSTRSGQGIVAGPDFPALTAGAEPTTTPGVIGLQPGAVTATTDSSTGNVDVIRWFEWHPDTFAMAEAEEKLILLDLNAVWCHWCHVMDETTYSDQAVIQAINELYIPVRVDTDLHTDLRPDVQARYLMNG